MVVYVVCFDLGASNEDQIKQIKYWLNFLNSSLPLPPPSTLPSSKWIIMLVGLRSDLSSLLQSDPSPWQPHHVRQWQKKWLRLPLFHKIFAVSSKESRESVFRLLQCIETECTRILDSHATQIPSRYLSLLKLLRSRPDNQSIVQEPALFAEYGGNTNKYSFSCMLRYFHATGHIALVKGGFVFTNPQLATKMAAKFISPDEVRRGLLKAEDEKIQVLTEEDVGNLLDISETNNQRYSEGHFVC
jgi:hypothetical protein